MPSVLYVGLQEADKIAVYSRRSRQTLQAERDCGARWAVSHGGRQRARCALCRPARRAGDHDVSGRSENQQGKRSVRAFFAGWTSSPLASELQENSFPVEGSPPQPGCSIAGLGERDEAQS
jgi:hypothetical protein